MAALRKKFRKLTEDHVSPTRNIIENIHRTGYFIPLPCYILIKAASINRRESTNTRKTASEKPFVFACGIKDIHRHRLGAAGYYRYLFSVCYYAINSIVKHNYLDSALDIADSLSQMSCYADEDQLKGCLIT